MNKLEEKEGKIDEVARVNTKSCMYDEWEEKKTKKKKKKTTLKQ